MNTAFLEPLVETREIQKCAHYYALEIGRRRDKKEKIEEEEEEKEDAEEEKRKNREKKNKNKNFFLTFLPPLLPFTSFFTSCPMSILFFSFHLCFIFLCFFIFFFLLPLSFLNLPLFSFLIFRFTMRPNLTPFLDLTSDNVKNFRSLHIGIFFFLLVFFTP